MSAREDVRSLPHAFTRYLGDWCCVCGLPKSFVAHDVELREPTIVATGAGEVYDVAREDAAGRVDGAAAPSPRQASRPAEVGRKRATLARLLRRLGWAR